MQMFYKFVALIVVCLMISNTRPQPSLEPEPFEDVCDGTHRLVNDFKVRAAFKFADSFITLIGESKTDKRDKKGAIRVIHSRGRPPTDQKTVVDKYYNPKVWADIQDLDRKKLIRVAFTARIKLFTTQPINQLVFLIRNENETTAYLFNDHEVKKNPKALKNTLVQEMEVFAPKKWTPEFVVATDHSDYLNLGALYDKFPHQLEILGILLFQRQNKRPSNELRKANPELRDYIHYAIVYTSEIYEGKNYYFRAYLRGSPTIPSRDGKPLKWDYDSNIDFCDELKLNRPTAALMLGEEEELTNSDSIFKKKIIFRFIEFYGKMHRVLRLVFETSDANGYTVYYEKDNGTLQDNAQTFINCAEPPTTTKGGAAECTDYANDYLVNENKSEDISESNYGRKFLWFAVIITIVIILVLLAFCVMSLAKK